MSKHDRNSGRAAPWLPLVAAILMAFGLAAVPCDAEAEVLWGANGHPLTAYPGVSIADQVAQLAGLGLRAYRVDVTSLDQMDRLGALVEASRPFGITILPVLIPPVNFEWSAARLHDSASAFAQAFVKRFASAIPVWELENELENYAIIQPCEMRDDGTKYPCEWGPAGGVGALDYVGARFAKVEAVIRGLSDGVRTVSPTARRAVGTAGWGHVGVFDRLKQDGVGWEISVWHLYGQDPEWAFKKLAEFGKPIWVTELNYPFGSSKEGEAKQAEGLATMMRRVSALSGSYAVEAAFVYELFDEPYWAPSFEASMGLVHLAEQSPKVWTASGPKAAFDAVKAVAAERR